MQEIDSCQTLEELSGSYYAIGVQHGRNNAAHMRYLLEAFGVDLQAPWREEEFLTPLRQYLPNLVEEIDGIVDGSKLTMREVCALSFLIDLSTASNTDPPIGSACTGIVFASGPDGPIVGKTSDCTPGVQQYWLGPRRVRPDDGLAAIIYSHIGTPNAEMGMNESGLAIGISGMLSRTINPHGVGWQQDIRGVLHTCTTTVQAIEMLRAVPIRRAGYAMVIGDATGDVAIVEKVVDATAVRRPAGNVAYEANIALCEEVLPHIDPAWCSDNGRGRTALLDRLCSLQTWPDYSLAGMLDLFSIHEQPVGICQHGPELHSHMGFFMLPEKKQVCIARGYTCERNIEFIGF